MDVQGKESSNLPLKNVTWILMEISCHFLSQIDGSLVEIDTKLSKHSMSFVQVLLYLFSRQKHDMDFTQVQVMECS